MNKSTCTRLSSKDSSISQSLELSPPLYKEDLERMDIELFGGFNFMQDPCDTRDSR